MFLDQLDRWSAQPHAISERFGDDMGRWAVSEEGDEVFIVESLPDGVVSLDVPTRRIEVTRARAEQIRIFIGAAIADTDPEPSSRTQP